MPLKSGIIRKKKKEPEMALTGSVFLFTLLASDTGSVGFTSGLEMMPVLSSLSNKELMSRVPVPVAANANQIINKA